MIDNNLKYLIKLSEEIKSSSNRRIIQALFFILITTAVASAILYALQKLTLQTYQELLQNIPEAFIYILLVIISIFITLFLFQIYDWVGSFGKIPKYEWHLENFDKDWIFQGIFELNRPTNSLSLTDADAGCLIKKRDWDNFILDFDFMVENEHGFGLIFRAKDLENYLMFRFNSGQKTKFHYRENGSWQIQKGFGPAVEMPERQWHHLKMTVKKRRVIIEINNQQIKYLIPNFAILNHLVIKNNSISDEPINNPLAIPVAHKKGSIGFRAYGDEKIYFKNLKVEKI